VVGESSGEQRDIFKVVQSYYSKPDVQKAIVEEAKSREVVSVFKDGAFGKRPDILQYPADIEQAVREGSVSFHGSVERWKQPMQLDTGMTKQQLDELRAGWDVLIDIDVPDFDIAKIFVASFVSAIRDHGVAGPRIGLKYTGGKSFHMCVPFESLPENIDLKPMAVQYPGAMQKVLEYLKWYTTDALRDSLIAHADPSELAEKVGKSAADIISEEGIEPFKMATMDIFGSRHMFRLPYSLHEKSLRVSLPIRVEDLGRFRKEDAEPEKVRVHESFIKSAGGNIRDAQLLVVEAFDWAAKNMEEKPEEMPKAKMKEKPMMKITEPNFPPCIQEIYKGLADGRKRSVFLMINYLRNMGWKPEEIEERLMQWNEKNYPPMQSNYIRSQLRWSLNQNRNILPPNCDNENFYKAFNVCKPDMICRNGGSEITIKNPINYAFRKMRVEGILEDKKNAKEFKTRAKYGKGESQRYATPYTRKKVAEDVVKRANSFRKGMSNQYHKDEVGG
jgi:hypothetical protein